MNVPELFPAIDLRAGRCVRLVQGDYDRETVYGDDPVAQALAFQEAGADWVHVVDLDAARSGSPVNRSAGAAVTAAGIYADLLGRAQEENIAAGRPKNDISFVRKLGMGCTSGAIGAFVGTPSELALVRMGADSKLPAAERRNYKNVVDCIGRIAREEGPTKLWRGAVPTIARATLLSACQMAITSDLKLMIISSGAFGPQG